MNRNEIGGCAVPCSEDVAGSGLNQILDTHLISSRWAASRADRTSIWINDLSSPYLSWWWRTLPLWGRMSPIFAVSSMVIIIGYFIQSIIQKIWVCCARSWISMTAIRSRPKIQYHVERRTVGTKCSSGFAVFENLSHRVQYIRLNLLVSIFYSSTKVDVRGCAEETQYPVSIHHVLLGRETSVILRQLHEVRLKTRDGIEKQF